MPNLNIPFDLYLLKVMEVNFHPKRCNKPKQGLYYPHSSCNFLYQSVEEFRRLLKISPSKIIKAETYSRPLPSLMMEKFKVFVMFQNNKRSRYNYMEKAIKIYN